MDSWSFPVASCQRREEPGLVPHLGWHPKVVLTAEANCRCSRYTHGSREEDKSKGKNPLLGSAATTHVADEETD